MARSRSARMPRYRFRIAGMGLVFIVASFCAMLLGAFPLAAGVSSGNVAAIAIGLVTFGVTAWLFVRCTRVAVVVSASGLVVRNLLSTHRLAWNQVADIRTEPVPAWAGIGGDHVALTIGVVDPSLTRIAALATRTVAAGSDVRLFPLLAVLDVHAAADDFTVEHPS